MATFRWYPIHDHAVTLAVNLPIGQDAFHHIRRLEKKATQQLPTLLNDLVPSYNSLTLIFKREHTWTDHIKKIDGLLLSISNEETSEIEKKNADSKNSCLL